ncbi:helix-turn-helix domain-containing protein [Maribacter sp.]|nr:helix-turn-helix domain-containing protein [Maribacter sp.]
MKLIYDFILVVGIIISIIILFLLIKNNKKELPKKILIIFFSLLLILNLHAYSYLHKLELLYKLTNIVNVTVIWFLGPLILVYIKSVFYDNYRLIRKNLKHFLAFFLFTSFVGLPLVFFQLTNTTGFAYIQYFDQNQAPIATFSSILFISYICLSLRIFNKYKNVIQHSHSSISTSDLNWIRNLLYGCLVFMTVDLITRWMDEFSIATPIDIGYFTMFSIILLIVYLGYYGIGQSKILSPNFLLEKGEGVIVNHNISRQHSLSNYTEDSISSLRKRLRDVMVIDKMYLNPELTLGKLAEVIGITDKKLSTLFNSYLETTFYDYVNSFRIDEVKKSFAQIENNKYTLLAIAMDCGFNSKASFNRIFKKETGLSPSQYRKKYTSTTIESSI